MDKAVQFSLFLVNKPGVLAQVTGQLAEAKVNLCAMTMVDSSEHGVLRLVASDPGKARRTLQRLELPMSETDVLSVTMSNRPGAMADICGKLAAAHININYAYCTGGAAGGKATGIFKVADLAKAIKVLAPATDRRRDDKRTRRRPASRARR